VYYWMFSPNVEEEGKQGFVQQLANALTFLSRSLFSVSLSDYVEGVEECLRGLDEVFTVRQRQ